MPKYRTDVQPLLSRSIHSLTLGIELFNRPSEIARTQATLMLLHHAFELFLKAAILQSGRPVHDKTTRYSFGFDKCLSVSHEDLRILSKDERASLSILDAQRDLATHYYAETSEDVLYVLAQSAVTLFGKLLKTVFNDDLVDHLPARVMPISARPPKSLELLLQGELAQVDEFLKPGRRQSVHAAARLRSIIAFATASRDEAKRVTEQDLKGALKKRRLGQEWALILPEVAQLRLSTEGDGIPVTMRISKSEGIPIRIVKPGEPTEGVLIKQEIDPFDKFNLGRDGLAEKLKLTGPKISALLIELDIHSDPECFRELAIGKVHSKRYSKRALDRLRQAISEGLDPEVVWAKHRHRFMKQKKRRR